MTKTFTAHAAPIALATVLTATMLLATNALAGHQYKVAAVAHQAQATMVAQDVQVEPGVARRLRA